MEQRLFVKDRSWKARFTSFRDAWRGLHVQLSTQANARIHALASVLAIGLGWRLGLTATEWCLVIGAIGLVWTAETFNTAIEFLVDLVSPEINPLAGRVKDLAAGAVLAAAITAAAIGALIFLPKLLALRAG